MGIFSIIGKLFSVEGNKTISDSVAQDDTAEMEIERGINSENPETRLSTLGILIMNMWAEDPKYAAEQMRIVALCLRHADPDMIRKAVTGLCEYGPIGLRYIELFLLTSDVNPQARIIIESRWRAAETAGFKSQELKEPGMKEQVHEIVRQASEQMRQHKFSQVFYGSLTGDNKQKTQLVYDLCRYREVGQHGLMSFKYTEDDSVVQDCDCLHVVDLFAQGNSYKEFHGLSNLPGIRYFGWSI